MNALSSHFLKWYVKKADDAFECSRLYVYSDNVSLFDLSIILHCTPFVLYHQLMGLHYIITYIFWLYAHIYILLESVRCVVYMVQECERVPVNNLYLLSI